MIICSFRRVKVWVCDFFPCVRHEADRNSSYAFASFSTVLRGLFVFQFCLCSDMSSHYCVFSLRLFTHCRDLIFLIFSGFYLWFVEFSSDFLSSPRSSHAIASTLMIRVRTIACTLYHINVNGKRTNDVYSRLITLTITFYVFQINFSASLWPNDKVRSLSHSFCRSLSLSVCVPIFCVRIHIFSTHHTRWMLELFDFEHKHWWCCAYFHSWNLFWFFCCFCFDLQAILMLGCVVHLLLLMSFPYTYMCETDA